MDAAFLLRGKRAHEGTPPEGRSTHTMRLIDLLCQMDKQVESAKTLTQLKCSNSEKRSTLSNDEIILPCHFVCLSGCLHEFCQSGDMTRASHPNATAC